MTELQGTLSTTSLGVKNSPSTKTTNFLFVRDEAISLMRLIENSDKLYGRPERHDVSKVPISTDTAAIDIPLLKFPVT
jgi:hypothetical protein